MLVSGTSAFLAAAATRYVIKTGWQLTTGREPPQNPASPRVQWGEAIGWAVATGVAASLGRLIAERGSAAGWRHHTGRYPKAVRRKRPKGRR